MNKTYFAIPLVLIVACIAGCISGGDSSTYKGELEDLALDTGLLPEGWYDHMEMATVDTCVPPIASAITIEVAHAYNPGNGYITARLFQNVTRATEGDAGSVYTTFVTGMVEQYGEAWHTQHEGDASLSEYAHTVIGDDSFACIIETDEVTDPEEDVHEEMTQYYVAFVNKDIVVTILVQDYPSFIGMEEVLALAADISGRI